MSRLAFNARGDGVVSFPRTLYETLNNGSTWKVLRFSKEILGASFIGESLWVLVGSCSAELRCSLEIAQSIDGGARFSSLRLVGSFTGLPQAKFESEPLGMGYFTNAWLNRANPSTAYVVVPTSVAVMPINRSLPSGFTGGLAYMFATTDGGATWLTRSVPCGQTGGGTLIGTAGAKTIWALCAGEPGAGSQPKQVDVSTDGGITWIIDATFQTSNTPSYPGDILELGYAMALDAFDPTSAILVSERAPLLRSDNSGKDWQPTGPTSWESLAQGGGALAESFGPSAATIWLASSESLAGVSSTHVWISADSGASWIEKTVVY